MPMLRKTIGLSSEDGDGGRGHSRGTGGATSDRFVLRWSEPHTIPVDAWPDERDRARIPRQRMAAFWECVVSDPTGMPAPDPEGLRTPELIPAVYDELKEVAQRCLAQEPAGMTLQATAL